MQGGGGMGNRDSRGKRTVFLHKGGGATVNQAAADADADADAFAYAHFADADAHSLATLALFCHILFILGLRRVGHAGPV